MNYTEPGQLLSPTNQPPVIWVSGNGRAQFIRNNLVKITAARWFFGKGPRRLRKKRAKEYLTLRFSDIQYAMRIRAFTRPMIRRLDYCGGVGRRAFVNEPLPVDYDTVTMLDNPD